MDAQLKRGLIEACILKLLTKGDSYGYQLVREAEEVLSISESTLYPVLRRLETAGALTVYSMEHNGRLRKYYAVTDVGRKKINEFLTEWEDVMKVYDFIRRDQHDA
ncbi:MAG: PadR family transcriptional regulator [Clostridia bacterium]|nr:PadR family transcriptional regulator [Clostridia bacterium]MBR6300416.1 PadR family transcriptional regulator [Clostridia bacterium]